MLTGEERGLITDMGDKLLDLYAKRDEAVLEGDLDRVHRLQAEIIEVADERQKIVHSVEAR
jgi:hypothetical protein